ncbi:putative anion transporter 3, chloroplastic [Orobanche hederae]
MSESQKSSELAILDTTVPRSGTDDPDRKMGSSFLWGYMCSSVIGGALVDKYGGKKVIAWGATLWSVATLLTPLAANHSATSLFAVRAFFGLAEGVALPSMNNLLSSRSVLQALGLFFVLTSNIPKKLPNVWFPTNERATAVGISMGGFQLGNVVGLVLTPLMMTSIGFSGPFILFTSLGLLWLITWTHSVANDPQESSSITIYELRLIQAGKSDSYVNKGKFPPLGLLSKLPTWAIIFANFTNNWGYFVLLSWMPVYFKTVFNVNLKQAAWFSAVPWGTMAVSGYIAGTASDYLIKSGCSITSARKIMQSIGFVGPGFALICLNYVNTPMVASIFLTIALSLSSFSQAGFLLNMHDIAPQYAGFIHGMDFKFSWNTGSNNQYNWDRVLCAMARVLPDILNSHSMSLFCHNHLLESLCYRRKSLLAREQKDLDPLQHGVVLHPNHQITHTRTCVCVCAPDPMVCSSTTPCCTAEDPDPKQNHLSYG